jgi:hypothetical protein
MDAQARSALSSPLLLRLLIFPSAVSLLQRRPLSSSAPPAAMAPFPPPLLPQASSSPLAPVHGASPCTLLCTAHSLRSSISPMVVSSPSGRHPPLCSAHPMRRQPIYAAVPVHSSEPHRSTRPWLPSFPSTSVSSSASRQSVQRATTSVSY